MLRFGLFLCAVACVALAAWALSEARAGEDVGAWARLGLAVGLLGAFAYVSLRIRPREGWGVRVEPLVISVSRPISAGEPLEIPWSQVSEVRLDGRRKEKLLIRVKPEGRILLARHLFASRAEFDELARTLETRAPATHDA